MQNLFNFLIRNYILFLFLVLQLIALTFTVNSLNYHNSVYFNSTNNVAGSLLDGYHQIEEFVNLKEANENLALENARLRSSLKQSYMQVYAINDTVVDTIFKQQYTYINAQVVNSSFTQQNNYMTINRGSRQGIKKGMGVLNYQGALGIVKSVSKNFSVVIPIINTKQNTTGSIAQTHHFGSISWDGDDYRFVQLSNIQKQAKFIKGDTVYTDIRSMAFPSGIPIGIIDNFKIEAQSQLYLLNVKLLPDFSSVNHVYVVNNLLKDEWIKTEKKALDEL